LRVGIGRPSAEPRIGVPVHDGDITDHVLGQFATSERKAAEQAAGTAVEVIECCFRKGLVEAMNQFNRRKSEP